MTAAQVRQVIAAWLHEEAAEMAKAATEEQELDALFDALGIILIALADHDSDAVRRAHVEYVTSQTSRSRDIKTIHHALISEVLVSLTQPQTPEMHKKNTSIIYARLRKMGFNSIFGDEPTSRDLKSRLPAR